jgi:hypothetical protein
VNGRVDAFLDVDLFHLWHGQPTNRKYQARHQTLCRFDLDPATDLAIAEDGPWRWNSRKPVLHQFLKSYFASRAEDETPPLIPTASPVSTADLSSFPNARFIPPSPPRSTE